MINETNQEEIKDMEGYLTRMHGSLSEKLFFLDHVSFDEITGIVDFGCADGALLQKLRHMGYTWKQVGIENNEAFREAFRSRNPEATWVKSKYPVLSVQSGLFPDESLLNLSSVIHEVYSYSSPQEIDCFWNLVFHSGFKYIAIRDMITTASKDEAVSLSDLCKLRSKDEMKDQLEDFQRINGMILTQRQLYHFLLKYRYLENWEREVCEDYLPLSLEDLLQKIPGNYEIVYQNVYTNEYIKATVFDDFQIDLIHPTHVQLVLRHVDEMEHEYQLNDI